MNPKNSLKSPVSNILYDMENGEVPEMSQQDQKKIDEKVLYSGVNKKKLKERSIGSDFTGNMTEFQLTFEWVWETEKDKRLHEIKGDNFGKPEGRFTGTIHIKDERLDEGTYPGKQQKIYIENGLINLIHKD